MKFNAVVNRQIPKQNVKAIIKLIISLVHIRASDKVPL